VCLALALEKKIELLLEEDPSPLGTTGAGNPTVRVPSREMGTPTKGSKKSKKKAKDDTIKVIKIPVVAGMGLGLKIKTDEAKQVARISEVRLARHFLGARLPCATETGIE
jgi:hypothetical protein